MSSRVNICQIVPTTFQGISIGSAMMTREMPTDQPRLGTQSAIAMPSGTSTSRHTKENASVRNKASLNRAPIVVAGFNRSRNHESPFQKKLFSPNRVLKRIVHHRHHRNDRG